jgi:PAS domain S-box-containing protein
MKILIVDDCRDDFEITGLKLQDLENNLDLEYAESGGEAILRLEEGGIDCVLSDYQMPGMNGLQLLRRLKEKGDETPFIFLTGQGNEQIAAEALRIGADDYFTKEAGIAHFQRLVNSIIRVVNARRASLESRAAQMALAESEERLRSQFKGLPVPTYTWQRMGDDFVLVDFNDAAMGITRGNVARFVGMTAGEMYKDVPEILEELERCLKDKNSVEREMVYHYTFGEKKYLAVKYAYAPPDLVLVHTEDISERKRAEELNRIQMDLAMKLSATSRLDDALKTCIEAAMKASGLDCGGVYLVDRRKGDLKLAHVVGLSEDFIKAVSHFEADSERTQLVKSGKPIHISYPAVSVPMDSAERQEGMRHISIIPILYEEEVIACLNTASHTLDSISVESQDALEAIGAQLGNAITRIMAVEALQESEEGYRRLVDSARDIISITDPNGALQFLNPAFEKILGWDREDYIGCSFEPLVHPDDLQTARRGFQALLKKEEGPRTVIRAKCKSGQYRTFELESTVIERKESVIGVNTILRDITDRKEAVERMRRERDMLNKLMDTSPVGIVVIDGADKIRMANAYAENALGLTKDAITQRTYKDPQWKITDFNGKPFSEKKLPFQIVSKSKDVVKDVRYAINLPDGRKILLSVSAAPLLNEEGEFDGIMAVVEDITEQVKAEQSLKESEERFRSIFETAPDGIFIADSSGRFLEVNKAACEQLGYNREELLQMSVFDIASPQYSERAARAIDRMKGESGIMESCHIGRDGTEIPIELSVRRITFRGRPVMMGIARDITERKKVEEAIKHSEEMYRQAVENSPNPIFSLDNEGHIQTWNPACEVLFKFGKEVIGKHYGCLMKDSKGRREFEKMLRDVFRGSSHSGVVLNLWDAEGSVHNVVSRFYPLYEEGGEVWRAMIASTDVTEELRTTLALENSERKFRRFFENAPVCCYMIDLDGRIIEVNRRTLEVLGYEKNELIGKKLIETVYTHPSREKAKRLFAEWKTTGSIRDEEIEVVTKSGEKRVVLLSVDGVKDGAGRLIHSISVQRDITERKRTEERLIESEEKFRELFHNIKDAIYLWEMQEDGTLGRCLEVNEVACQLSGYTREEILAQTPVDINEPEFVNQLPVLLEKLKKSKHVMFRNILITKSGKRIPVEVHDHLFNLKGRQMILSVTRNIQDRIDLEKDLRFKEYTLEHVADAAFWIGPDAKFIEVNEAACRHLGYSRDELLSMTVHDIDPEFSAEKWPGYWQKLKEQKTLAMESSHHTKNGRVIPVEIVADYLEFEGMEYNCAFARDISERRRSEKIRDTVQRIAAALITARDLDDLFKSIHGFLGELFPIENFYIALYDPNTEMLSFPYFVDEYEDTPAPYKLGSGLTEYVLRTGKPLLATPDVVKKLEEEGEVELIGPPSLDWLGVPLHTHDKTIGVLVVQTYSQGVRYGEEEKRMLEFVSTQVAMAIERKKAEEELKRSRDQLFLANKELESFSYSVSHDLRAPLRNIVGFGEALLERHREALNDDAKHYLERIFSNTRRMTSLIDHMLQLSKISRSDLNRCKIDLSVLAMEIIEDLQSDEPDRNVDFSIQKDVLAVADETLIRNVMENLLRNAWKFTSKRDEALIEFGAWSKDGMTVYFVRDNGVGFDQAQADKLFSPFSRLHTEEEFEGTGIGLATVQRIIHRHGGRIWAEGIENEGATFYFTLS